MQTYRALLILQHPSSTSISIVRNDHFVQLDRLKSKTVDIILIVNTLEICRDLRFGFLLRGTNFGREKFYGYGCIGFIGIGRSVTSGEFW